MNIESGRILLVDHSRGALLFEETILRRRHNVVATALTGTVGLERLRQERPHLVIFGFDLFDMSGPEFCRAVREDEEIRSTSLLLVAERYDGHQADLCLSAGCNDVIYRPLHRGELDQKIEKLTRIPARRQLRTMTRVEISLENGGRVALGRSVNVSSGGMLIELDRVLPGEGAMSIHFYLPCDPEAFHVPAEVVRASFSGTRALYGVRFLTLSAGERERIDRYVSRLRSRMAI